MSLTRVNYSKVFRATNFELVLSERAIQKLYLATRERIFDVVQKRARRYTDKVVTAEEWLVDCNSMTEEVLEYVNLLTSEEDTIVNVDGKI